MYRTSRPACPSASVALAASLTISLAAVSCHARKYGDTTYITDMMLGRYLPILVPMLYRRQSFHRRAQSRRCRISDVHITYRIRWRF